MEKTWIRQPQENDGDYHFNGKILVTKGVHEALPPEEVLSLIMETKKAVAESSGLDYLQVFKHKETGQKIHLYFRCGELLQNMKKKP